MYGIFSYIHHKNQLNVGIELGNDQQKGEVGVGSRHRYMLEFAGWAKSSSSTFQFPTNLFAFRSSSQSQVTPRVWRFAKPGSKWCTSKIWLYEEVFIIFHLQPECRLEIVNIFQVLLKLLAQWFEKRFTQPWCHEILLWTLRWAQGICPTFWLASNGNSTSYGATFGSKNGWNGWLKGWSAMYATKICNKKSHEKDVFLKMLKTDSNYPSRTLVRKEPGK